MIRDLDSAHYKIAFEEGQLVRRGVKYIDGREVKTYDNYFNLPRDTWPQAEERVHAEVAAAIKSDPESVRQRLLANYNRACEIKVANAHMGIFDPVPVEPIEYTVNITRQIS